MLFQKPGVGISGRQAYSMGQLQHQQGSRHSPEVFMGHDLRLRSIGLIRRLRRFGQHLLHLQVGLRIFLHPVGAVQGFFLSKSRERLSRLALLFMLSAYSALC